MHIGASPSVFLQMGGTRGPAGPPKGSEQASDIKDDKKIKMIDVSCMGSMGSPDDDERDRMRKAAGTGFCRFSNAHAVRDDALDLSISLRAGEETNVDSRSRGDRTGKSPSGKRKRCDGSGTIPWKGEPARVRAPGRPCGRVGLLGCAARSGGGTIEG